MQDVAATTGGNGKQIERGREKEPTRPPNPRSPIAYPPHPRFACPKEGSRESSPRKEGPSEERSTGHRHQSFTSPLASHYHWRGDDYGKKQQRRRRLSVARSGGDRRRFGGSDMGSMIASPRQRSTRCSSPPIPFSWPLPPSLLKER